MKEIKDQLISALLVIVTVAAVISAGINFQQQQRFHLPDDGVTWVDRDGAVKAVYIAPDSGAARAGLRAGDADLHRRSARSKRRWTPPGSCSTSAPGPRRITPSSATASFSRRKSSYRSPRRTRRCSVSISRRRRLYSDRPFRLFPPRQRAESAALLRSLPDLVHLVLLPLHRQAEQFRSGDVHVQRGGDGILAPTMFLHFCLTFPERRRWLRGVAALRAHLRAGAALLFGITCWHSHGARCGSALR